MIYVPDPQLSDRGHLRPAPSTNEQTPLPLPPRDWAIPERSTDDPELDP